MTTIADLYKLYETLDGAKEKAGEHEAEYRSIIHSVQTGQNAEKRLASQFMVKFIKYFPSLKVDVFNILLQLCGSQDVNIRRQVVKDIETLCKDSPESCQATAEALTQLLQTTDAAEQTLVQKGLATLLKTNAKGTLDGIFHQIIIGEELVRERAITFLLGKVKTMLSEDLLPKDIEEFIVQHCRKVLEDVSGAEFVLIIRFLASLPSMNTLTGRQQILDIVTEQAELTEEFQPGEVDCIERLIQCVKEAMPLFSKNAHSTKFVEYICLHVLPVCDVMSEESTAELFKLLAEMVPFCGDIDKNVAHCVASVYAKLLEYMPLPKADEAVTESDEAKEPQLNFSYVECLMYTFHQLARKYPEFLTAESNAERLKDFRVRLQYFARGVQIYIRILRQSLQGKPEASLKDDENKVKLAALKTTNNINSLIKDLFYNPPAYKAIIQLSFKPTAQPAAANKAAESGAQKKKFTPVTFGNEPVVKKVKNDRPVYAPPSGKFSERAGQYQQGEGNGRGRGFRGRGRGGGRGYRW